MPDGVARRLVVESFGGPEVLRVTRAPVPEPGPGEVRVRMLAAGLARADLLQRAGAYPGGPRPPFVPGWDVVGRVEAVGESVGSDLVGATVAALVLAGGHATHVVARADRLVRLPQGVDPVEAACLPVDHVTAAQLLALAQVPAGGVVLVHGASGGVGTALLALARRAGLRAVGTASPTGHEVVASLGAVPLDRRRAGLADAVRAAAGGKVDAAFVAAGGVEVRRAGDAVRRGGRLVSYGFAPDPVAPRRALVRQAGTLLAWAADPRRPAVRVYRLSCSARRDPVRLREDLTGLVDLLAAGEIQPCVAARVPLAEAARAHAVLEERGAQGKVVLVP